MQQLYQNRGFQGYDRFMNYISNIAHMSQSDQHLITERIKIIEFYDKFGQEATKLAFKRSKSTIMLWKQRLKRHEGRLSSLKPGSRAPKSERAKRKVGPEITGFILNYRKEHPGVSKETIKPQLDIYCLANNLPIISESSIGRIIHYLKEKGLVPKRNNRLSFYAHKDIFKERRSKSCRIKKQRVKDFKPGVPGDLVQIDAITVFTSGVRRYLITGIDIKTRFAFAYSYKTLSSYTAADFLKKFIEVAPFPVSAIQTDNGAEFHKYFKDYAEKHEIKHFWSYPHHPQSNAYIERFNGLIQDQFVSWHLQDMLNLEKFNLNLMDYLIWYNTEKPHGRLGKIPPLRYYLDNLQLTPLKSNMLWTGTGY